MGRVVVVAREARKRGGKWEPREEVESNTIRGQANPILTVCPVETIHPHPPVTEGEKKKERRKEKKEKITQHALTANLPLMDGSNN